MPVFFEPLVETCQIWILKLFSATTNYILGKCNLITWLAQRRGREPLFSPNSLRLFLSIVLGSMARQLGSFSTGAWSPP